MSRAKKLTNLAAVLIPFVGFGLAVGLLWNHGTGPLQLSLFAGMYLATAIRPRDSVPTDRAWSGRIESLL